MSNFNVSTEISLEEGVGLYEARIQQAMATLNTKGFTMSAPPTVQTQGGTMPYRGELPPDLTTLNDSQLGTYMGLLSEWSTYVRTQMAEAQANFDEALAEQVLIEAKLRISYKMDEDGKKRSNPERDDMVGADRRYVEAKSKVIYWDTIRNYIKAIAFGAEAKFSAISRRITQRGQDLERERRTHGTTGGSNIPTGPMFNRPR